MATGKVASRSSGRGATARSTANGKVKTVKVKNLRLTIPNTVPLGSFRAAFKDEASNEDVVKFLNGVLGEAQMEQFWAIDLDLADGPLSDQVTGLLAELAEKVQAAVGLSTGE